MALNPTFFNVPNRFAEPARDAGLLLLRITLSGLFIFHGGAKFANGIDGFAGYLASLNVPFPLLNAYLAAGTEVLAGLAVLVGLFTRLAAVPLVVTMAVAFFLAKGAELNPQGGGGEYALALGLVAVTLILTGPGRFNVTTPLLHALAGKTKSSSRETPNAALASTA